MKQERVAGYKVVAQVDFSEEQKRKFHLATPKDPFLVDVEGVNVRRARFMGSTKKGDWLVRLYDRTNPLVDDRIIQVPPDKVKPKL